MLLKVLIGAACVAVILGVAAYIGTILDKPAPRSALERTIDDLIENGV